MQLSPCLAEAECSEFRLTRSRASTQHGERFVKDKFISVISYRKPLCFQLNKKLCVFVIASVNKSSVSTMPV